MGEDLISIIIPVYNMEKYLNKCLDSVLNQTYNNIEIILINDGSKDNSEKICKLYEKKDSRIIFINKENEGVSSARNLGLDIATGKYIFFVDSDDYIKENTIEKLYNNMVSSKAELSICGFYEDINGKLIPRTEGEIEILDKRNAIKRLLMKSGFQGYLWNKLFIKEKIKKNNISFDKKIDLWEDVLFVFNYMMCCERIVYDPSNLYIYLNREDSAVHNKAFNINLLSEREAKKIIEKKLSDNYKEEKNILYNRIIEGDLSIIRKIALDYNEQNSVYYNEIADEIKKYSIYLDKNTSYNDKISIFLIKINKNLYRYLYRLLKH